MTSINQRLANLEAAILDIFRAHGEEHRAKEMLAFGAVAVAPFPAAWCPQCGPYHADVVRVGDSCAKCGDYTLITHPETLATLRAGWESRGGK